MARYLSIVERPYRATVEEQDDTALWFTHMIKNAGGEMSALLRSNATNYAVRGQDASGLRFGHAALSVPPTLDKDVEELIKKGVPVYVVREDLDDRGIRIADLVPGVEAISRQDVARLFDEHDQIWHW